MTYYSTYFKKLKEYYYIIFFIILVSIILFSFVRIIVLKNKNIPETTVLKVIELKNTGTISRYRLKYISFNILLVYFTVPILIFFLYSNSVNIIMFLTTVYTFILRFNINSKGIISGTLNNISPEVNNGFFYNIYEYLNLNKNKTYFLFAIIFTFFLIIFKNIGNIIYIIRNLFTGSYKFDIKYLLKRFLVLMYRMFIYVKTFMVKIQLFFTKVLGVNMPPFIKFITFLFKYILYLFKLFINLCVYHILYNILNYNILNYEYYVLEIYNIILLEKTKEMWSENKIFSGLNVGILKFKEDFIGFYYLKNPNRNMVDLHNYCSNDEDIANDFSNSLFFSNSEYTILNYLFNNGDLSTKYADYHKYISAVENIDSFISKNINRSFKKRGRIKTPVNLYVYTSNILLPVKKIIYVDIDYMPFFEHLISICEIKDFDAIGRFYLKIKNTDQQYFYDKIYESILPSGIILRTIRSNEDMSSWTYLKILFIYYFSEISTTLKLNTDFKNFRYVRIYKYVIDYSKITSLRDVSYMMFDNKKRAVQGWKYYYNRYILLQNLNLFS